MHRGDLKIKKEILLVSMDDQNRSIGLEIKINCYISLFKQRGVLNFKKLRLIISKLKHDTNAFEQHTKIINTNSTNKYLVKQQ